MVIEKDTNKHRTEKQQEIRRKKKKKLFINCFFIFVFYFLFFRKVNSTKLKIKGEINRNPDKEEAYLSPEEKL